MSAQEEFISRESEEFRQLHQIVERSIAEERLLMDDLLHPAREILTAGQSLSDRVAAFGGSWTFIIAFMALLLGWILFNTLLPGKDHFDPYPFILMNLVLSCVAALQAPIIMMSQNRQEEKDRRRAENDYLINLKAELEIRSLQQKMDLLLEKQIRTLYEMQNKQLQVLEEIERKMHEK